MGSDGNLWFTDSTNDKIKKITTNGLIVEYNVPTPGGHPGGITLGPDGNMWFAETDGNKVGKITPSGVVTEYAVVAPSELITGITLGPDGNLWFGELFGDKIGKMTTEGVVTEYGVPNPPASPVDIITGPDGNLWFTGYATNEIVRITNFMDAPIVTPTNPNTGPISPPVSTAELLAPNTGVGGAPSIGGLAGILLFTLAIVTTVYVCYRRLIKHSE